MSNPSRAIALYGTKEDVAPPRVLRAGKLSAELEAGNLRYIRWNGEEVLRAISFVVRDRDWGTYTPEISALEVQQTDMSFTVSLSALTAGDGQRFAYDVQIEGSADGTLLFRAQGSTETGFQTNRTGFVILHPIDGIAGAPVRITHTDGRIVDDLFPEIIDPVQPMMDLRALEHTTPDGVLVKVLMEGDTFEMEDQRNWTDASYKTYVRPLALPWPYRIEADEWIEQSVTVTLRGDTEKNKERGAVSLNPGSPIGKMPPLGIGLRPQNSDADRGALDALRSLGPAYVIVHHDPRAGHDRATLNEMLDIASQIGAAPWLEAVIESTDDDGAGDEIAALGQIVASLGHPFDTVMVSPAPDLKCTLPGSVWPDAPDAATLYAHTRTAFPKARIGGGMFSYFTELNRKRPPAGTLDLITFTTSPMVHAGDDRSVMESREAHGAIAASVSEIAGDTPWAVGPSAIGIRDNPYGSAAKDNPDNIRQAMNRNDPRQRGLMGAAWSLGYISDFAGSGAAGIALGGATGPFGVISAPGDDPDPWYGGNGQVYPGFHVLRGLMKLKGQQLLALDLPASGPVAALAAKTVDGTEIWAANTGPDPIEVSVPDQCAVAVLDAARFSAAAAEPAYLDTLVEHRGTLTLDGFAVVRLHKKG